MSLLFRITAPRGTEVIQPRSPEHDVAPKGLRSRLITQARSRRSEGRIAGHGAGHARCLLLAVPAVAHRDTNGRFGENRRSDGAVQQAVVDPPLPVGLLQVDGRSASASRRSLAKCPNLKLPSRVTRRYQGRARHEARRQRIGSGFPPGARCSTPDQVSGMRFSGTSCPGGKSPSRT